MLRRGVCALVMLFLLAGLLVAAEYKGTLVALKKGESITVKIGGKMNRESMERKRREKRWAA